MKKLNSPLYYLSTNIKIFSCLIILLFSQQYSFGQNKKDFYIQFSSHVNEYKMTRLNDFLIDTLILVQTENNGDFKTKITQGYSHNFGIYFQPLNFMDFGIFTSYQFAKLERSINFYDVEDPVFNPDVTVKHAGTYQLDVKSYTIGLSSNVYFNKLLKLDQSNKYFLKRLRISSEFNFGYSLSELFEYAEFPTANAKFHQGKYRDQYYSGNVNLKLGFAFVQSVVFSELGVKIGYQFNESGTITDRANIPITENGKDLNLDFSGWQYGIYLKFGK